MAAVAEWAVVAPPTQLAAAHSVAAVEVLDFYLFNYFIKIMVLFYEIMIK